MERQSRSIESATTENYQPVTVEAANASPLTRHNDLALPDEPGASGARTEFTKLDTVCFGEHFHIDGGSDLGHCAGMKLRHINGLKIPRAEALR
jgi:hypothetical protein